MQRNKKTIRKGNRQKAWQYMRRNPIFSVKDILILIEMSEKSLMLLVRQLVDAKYLKQIRVAKAFNERTYKLVKNTGIVCPSWVVKQEKLFDANINAFGLVRPAYVHKEAKAIQNVPVTQTRYAADRLMQLLRAEKKGLSEKALANRSGVPASELGKALTLIIGESEAVLEFGFYKEVVS